MKKSKISIVMLVACLSFLFQYSYADRCTAQVWCEPLGTYIGCAGEVECVASGGTITCDGVVNDCPGSSDPIIN